MTNEYSTHFDSENKVEAYDYRYVAGTYDAILGGIERAQLRNAILKVLRPERSSRWLDYATGTGRAVSYASDLISEIVAMDSSAEMIERARHATPAMNVTWLVGNLLPTGSGELELGRFDLVTAFRLLLNIEPAARPEVMKRLGDLVSPGGLLIVNTHGNPRSIKSLAVLWRRMLKTNSDPATLKGSYLSVPAVCRIAADNGLEAVAVFGCGVLSAKAVTIFGHAATGILERALARSRIISKLGINQMILVRPVHSEADDRDNRE